MGGYGGWEGDRPLGGTPPPPRQPGPRSGTQPTAARTPWQGTSVLLGPPAGAAKQRNPLLSFRFYCRSPRRLSLLMAPHGTSSQAKAPPPCRPSDSSEAPKRSRRTRSSPRRQGWGGGGRCLPSLSPSPHGPSSGLCAARLACLRFARRSGKEACQGPRTVPLLTRKTQHHPWAEPPGAFASPPPPLPADRQMPGPGACPSVRPHPERELLGQRPKS